MTNFSSVKYIKSKTNCCRRPHIKVGGCQANLMSGKHAGWTQELAIIPLKNCLTSFENYSSYPYIETNTVIDVT